MRQHLYGVSEAFQGAQHEVNLESAYLQAS